MGALAETDLVGALGVFETVLRENGWNAEPGSAPRAALIALEEGDRALATAVR